MSLIELHAWLTDFMERPFYREYNEYTRRPFGFYYRLNWKEAFLELRMARCIDGTVYEVRDRINLSNLGMVAHKHRRAGVAREIHRMRAALARQSGKPGLGGTGKRTSLLFDNKLSKR